MALSECLFLHHHFFKCFQQMEKKKQENKMRRDQLNDQYLELLEKQRLYFKTVKEFKEEGRKNELLLSKIKAKAS